MKKYRLKGIDSPGTVDLYKIGKVNLEDLPEDKLDALYQEGFPYLELIDEKFRKLNPQQKEIKTTKIPAKVGNKKQHKNTG